MYIFNDITKQNSYVVARFLVKWSFENDLKSEDFIKNLNLSIKLIHISNDTFLTKMCMLQDVCYLITNLPNAFVNSLNGSENILNLLNSLTNSLKSID